MIRILLLLFLFSSCGSNLLVTSKGCHGDLLWIMEDLNKHYDFEVREDLLTPFGPFSEREVELRNALKDNKIDCNKVEQISMTVTTSKSAILASLLPFTAKRTLIIRGRMKQVKKK